jgi:hypothetical protein
MYIPGLEESSAAATTVLTSIRHDPATSPPSGFRTNVGVFNPGASPVTVTFTIFDGGRNRMGVPVARSAPGHSGVQVSGIFAAAGAGAVSTENAVIVVTSSGPVFSYAAVLDNRTTDPIFVVGARDLPQQPITPVATAIAVPTPIPTPPAGGTRQVDVGFMGNDLFHDETTGQSTSIIHVNDTVIWVWNGGNHSVTSGPCCTGDGQFNAGPTSEAGHTFSHTFTTPGSTQYFCSVHRNTGLVVVQ